MQACAMTHLTVAIDDELLRAARIMALQQGTSVNEICREAVTRFAAPGDPGVSMAQLIAMADRMRQTGSPEAMRPSREAMCEEGMAERMPTLWATPDGKKLLR